MYKQLFRHPNTRCSCAEECRLKACFRDGALLASCRREGHPAFCTNLCPLFHIGQSAVRWLSLLTLIGSLVQRIQREKTDKRNKDNGRDRWSDIELSEREREPNGVHSTFLEHKVKRILSLSRSLPS